MSRRSETYYARTAQRFRKQRYLLVRGFLPETMLSYLQAYYDVLLTNKMLFKDEQCPLSLSLSGDPAFDAMLEWLRPEVGRLIGCAVAPTYSYTRRYARGDELVRHLDREACEISATICIAIPKGAAPSPLCVQSPNGRATKIEMLEGDCCIYAGTEVEHWRESFRATGYLQLFLHFIKRRGRHYPRWLYDGRKYLGADYKR
jgi:hypothetical protein